MRIELEFTCSVINSKPTLALPKASHYTENRINSQRSIAVYRRHIDSDLLKWNWTMRRPLSVREWILLSPLICLYASIALWFFCQIPRKPDCISSIPNGLRTLAVITGTQLTCSSCLSLNKQTQHHFQAVYSAAYDSSNDNIIPYIETAKCGHTNHIQIELLDAHHCCRVE